MADRHRPRFRLYMAASLDGFIANADGGVEWLDPYDPYEVGFAEFVSAIGAIVMGRKSYEQMLAFGPWPYAGKRTIVMTRSPFTPTTADTETSDAPAEEIADRLAADTKQGDVWIFGGGEIARAFLRWGRVDTLELCIVPLVLGDGIALFGPGTRSGALKLKASRTYANGLVCLDYEIVRAGQAA
jgi:dihydrofolate reductase